ncbi:MAG: hypothetical protein ABIK15_09730 [Pseudomonadota bacterium]
MRLPNYSMALRQLTKFIEKGELNDLDDLLLPWTIDLSIYSTLDHVKLREHIERVGVIFYQRSSGDDKKIILEKSS